MRAGRAVRLLRETLVLLMLTGMAGSVVADACPDPVRSSGSGATPGACELPATAREDLALLETPADREGLGSGGSEALRAIASDMAVEMEPESVGLWERFAAWLGRLLSADGEGTQWPAWLDDWLGELSVSTSTVQILYYIVLVILASFVGWFLLRELRAARRDRLDPPAPAGVGPVDDGVRRQPVPPDAIGGLEPEERPAAWVAWTVAVLARRDRFDRASAWTNREIAADLERRRPELASVFRRLAVRADAVTFGGREPDREIIEGVETDAREFVDRLAEGST